MTCEKFSAPGQVSNGEVLAYYRLGEDGSSPVRVNRGALKEASADRPVFALVMRQVAPRPSSAGFPYVDLTRPETFRLFMETTHRQYAERFGDRFGRELSQIGRHGVRMQRAPAIR